MKTITEAFSYLTFHNKYQFNLFINLKHNQSYFELNHRIRLFGY